MPNRTINPEPDPDTTGATEVRFLRKTGSQEFVSGHIAGVWDGQVHVAHGPIAGAGPLTESDYSEPLDDLGRVDMVLYDLAQGPEESPGGWVMSWGEDTSGEDPLAGQSQVATREVLDPRRRGVAGTEIGQVDERDSAWEENQPRFRVYLHGSADDETHGWTDTYDITGANILQVIDWAQRQAGTVLTYAVALVVDDDIEERNNPGFGRGLIWLLGVDGNAGGESGDTTQAWQQRMLARRRHHIRLNEGDTMPTTVLEPYEDGQRTADHRRGSGDGLP